MIVGASVSNPSSKRRGRPALISRAQILDAALAIVDEHGLEALTMRRLGAALGVDPMTIYHHVPDKTALFDGLVEQIFVEIAIPAPTGRWHEDVRAIARSARATFLAHPHVVALLGTRPPVTEQAFDLVEAVTTIALRAGLGEQRAVDAFDCVGRLVIGHVLAEAGRPPGGEVSGGEDEHLAAQGTLPPDRYPSIAAVERAGVRHDPDRLFELALDGLIASLSQSAEPATRRQDSP
jgi:TetR/AcrR family transcriptional regulator, tetracycline repressor protein